MIYHFAGNKILMRKTLFLIFLLFLSCTKETSESEKLTEISYDATKTSEPIPKDFNSIVQGEKDKISSKVAENLEEDDEPVLIPENIKPIINFMSDKERKACLKTEKANKRYMVKLNNKIGYIDGCGRKITEAKYDFGFDFSEGLAAVKKGDKYGFINMDGKEITEFIYDDVSFFSEGLARVEINGTWGFIDKTGRLKIKPQYGWAYNFHNGYAAVKNYEGMIIIDHEGKNVFGKAFEDVGYFIENKFAFDGIKSEAYGFIMNKGYGKIKSYYYDYIGQNFKGITCFDDKNVIYNGFFIAKTKESCFMLDKKGEKISKFDSSMIPEKIEEKEQTQFEDFANFKGEKLKQKDFTAIKKCEQELSIVKINETGEKILINKNNVVLFRTVSDFDCPKYNKIIYDYKRRHKLYDLKKQKILLNGKYSSRGYDSRLRFVGKTIFFAQHIFKKTSISEIFSENMEPVFRISGYYGANYIKHSQGNFISITNAHGEAYYLYENGKVFWNNKMAEKNE